ncbi:MAG: YihY/virulence factor BrkB family protein [Thermoleophilaceae bacterium]|nr:YihY/virulence factor BrkB family protein [Thermoleophilaceae bacterium]
MASARPASPARLDSSGWKAALRRTFDGFRSDQVTDLAAGLTYYGVLALFPALIALVSIVGLFGDPGGTTRTLTDIVSDLGPETAADTFNGPIENLTADRETAGALFVVGLLGALYSASGYVGAFMRASNRIYGVQEGRPFWKLRPLQIAVTLVMVLLVALVVVALVLSGPVAEAVGKALGLTSTAVTIYGLAKWPVLAAVVLTMLAFLYYVSPNVRLPAFRWITPGSMVAVALWILASIGFAFYVSNFGSYDKTYGTLGGVVTFLVWVWITNIAVLLGVELNAELERAREIQAGVAGAEESIQLRPREQPGG